MCLGKHCSQGGGAIQKLAVGIIHGIGKQDEHFADRFIRRVGSGFEKYLKHRGVEASDALVFEPVLWQDCVQQDEDELWNKVKSGGVIRWRKLRRFLIDFAGDAIAYQPVRDYQTTYVEVHQTLAKSFQRLARVAGDRAPLCLIAHSLGSVITSNYLYDLQVEFGGKRQGFIPESISAGIDDTPLEHGETLSYLVTMGNPHAVWSLRYRDFGSPVRVPSPILPEHWGSVRGGWTNIYSQYDTIGFPLKSLNDAYDEAVKDDLNIWVGNLLTFWNPFCHTAYWKNRTVIDHIAHTLAAIWKAAND